MKPPTSAVPTREYDREFTTPVGFRARRRVGFDTDRGAVTRFVVQLEYRVGNGWVQAVRLDHDPDDYRVGSRSSVDASE